MMGIKLFVKAIVAGSAIGCVPLLMLYLLQNSRLRSPVWDNLLILYVPGTLLGMLLNAGRVHDVGRIVFVGGTCLFYTAVSYVFLRIFQRSGRQE
jgi:hypothetical protein